MKNVLLLLTMLITIVSNAQIPTSYSQSEISAINETVRILNSQYDVVIDPIERMPIAPTAMALAEGNWANQFMGLIDNYEIVKDRAQRKVVVFVLDTGGKFDHDFLAPSAWNEMGKDFTGSSLNDVHGHATHCAGIVAAVNGDQPLGVCRALVEKGLLKVVPVKVLNDSGSGSYTWINNGLVYVEGQAQALQADGWFVVVSMSLGGRSPNTTVSNTLKRLAEKGIFVVAASGNNYSNEISFPASDDNTYAIGAIDQQGKRAPFSNYGDGLWKVEPGVSILSTYKNNTLATLSGTSMATPAEAGSVAIVASIYPNYDANGVRGVLQYAAKDLGTLEWDEETGWGYTWIKSILEYDGDPPPPPPNPEPEPEPEPEPPKHSKRVVRMVIPGPYKMLYKIGGGPYNDIYISNIIYDHLSHEMAGPLIQRVTTEADSYFTNRAIIVSEKHDFLDAGYWLGEFFKMHLKNELGLKMKQVQISVIDENGSKGIGERTRKIIEFNQKSKFRSFKY